VTAVPRPRRGVEMRRGALGVGAVLAVLLCAWPGPAAATSTADEGVSATAIRIGVPYVDFAAVRKVGVNIDDGNTPDAFNALIANLNAHGGIHGRRIVAYLVAVDPTSPAPAATTCTQLTQDDKVFVAIGPLMPDCYLSHGVPTIAAILPGSATTGSIPNFGLTPPADAYDPLQLRVFASHGVFKAKKVAVFAGATTDENELALVARSLRTLRVHVVATAVDSAPQADLVAENQQVAVIAQRFESLGVDEVVAVGYGSSIWPEALSANQSTYHPPWVATNVGDLTGYTNGSNDPAYVKNVVVSSPSPLAAQSWHTAAIQRCVRIVKRAYPTDTIDPPPAVPTHSSEMTYAAPLVACADLALFTAIATAAGRHLTVSSFIRAGDHLHGVVLPGSTAPISFAPGRPYPLGSVYLGHYDVAAGTIVYSSRPARL
jgi:hypothetical protein